MKAEAVAAKVRHYNGKGNAAVMPEGKSGAAIIAACEHLCAQNIDELLGGAKVVLDATDNWRARALLNEWCWKNTVPWVYCGALGARAMAAAIIPKQRPCWLCWNAVEPAEVASCSVFGIDGRAADAAAQKAGEQALAIAAGTRPALAGKLFFADVEKGIEAENAVAAKEGCEVCAKRRYRLLAEEETAELVCGSGQWLFPNAGLKEKVRHYTKAEVARKLGRGAKVAGEVVAMERNGANAIRVTMRAASESWARKLNDEIAQRLTA